MCVFTDPNSAAVEAHLLSNGNYHVAVTSRGRLQSLARFGGHAVARRFHPRQLWELLLRAPWGECDSRVAETTKSQSK